MQAWGFCDAADACMLSAVPAHCVSWASVAASLQACSVLADRLVPCTNRDDWLNSLTNDMAVRILVLQLHN
jgi:hypothetical protein